MEEVKNIFVYAVCGDNVHINTLNFSLRYLKKFSKNQIVVVTDKKRNNTDIRHDNIIDIETSSDYSNHQASIYLKTSLHKYLDLKHNYCYLDSDVIAVNHKVDDIFLHNYGPVTFAADHCKLNEFSPYALNCGCLEKTDKSKALFYELQKKYSPDFVPDSIFATQEARQLYCDLYNVKQNPFSNIGAILRYIIQKVIFPYRFFKLNENFKFDKKQKFWLNKNNEFVMADILNSHKKIERNSEFKFDKLRKTWKDKDKHDIFKLKCNHLHYEILEKYSIKIQPTKWQHWNGGVFLFNNKSVDFLNIWHKLTIDNFFDTRWKTRDQGTLAATVWKNNLENQRTLPLKFNFIADFYKPQISYNANKGFTIDNFQTSFQPYFIHVYHHFGDERWNIWKYISSLL